MLALLLFAFGCATPQKDGPPATPVILVSIDTLRADRLPAYGYAGVATPAIDAFSRDAVLFERAYSHYPLTLPAHVSVLSGLLPSEHGVRDNLGYEVDFAPEDPYLPRILREAGWATGAAVSAYVLRPKTGLDADFDFYDANIEVTDVDRAEGLGEVQRRGDETLTAALDWLGEVGERPFFLFLHFYEPHTPYAPPEPFASRYADPYDGEIAAVDAVFGRFIEALGELGLYERSLIVLFSDHGEGLGDHGEQEHGLLLYRETLEVPLMVKLPGGDRAGRRSAEPAQLVDVVPTVLDVTGLPVPERLRGRSLVELLDARGPARPIYAETFYPRLHMGWSELTSLIEGDYQLIDGPDPELYDLARDRRQQDNLLRAERGRYRRLADALKDFERPLEGPGEVDPETRERLAALGYLASPAAARQGPLPDPKSAIHQLDALGEAMRLVDREAFAEAVPRLEALLAENPGMQDAWQALALALRGSGRYPEALAAYQKLRELVGAEAYVVLGMAELYLQLGQVSAAVAHAELALADDPAGAHRRLSEAALAENDLAAAERHARAAVEARELAVAPLIQLAKILVHQGRLEETRGLLAEIDEEIGRRARPRPMADLHFVRGELLVRSGDAEAGRRQLEAEIEEHPDNLDAYTRLVFLHTAEGRMVEATELLRRMVESSPTPAAYVAAVKTLRLLGDESQAAALLRFARGRFPDAETLRELVASSS